MKYSLYRNELNPTLWKKSGNTYKLDSEVRNNLLKIADDFVSDLKENNDLEITNEDVIIIGSSTNYNWTDYSDIDLHIITDFSKLDMSKEDARVLFDALKLAWNTKHTITMKGHDVELYVQDVSAKAVTASAYSIKNNKWITEPVKLTTTFDKALIKKKYKEYKNKINELLNKQDEDGLKKLLEKLYNYRQAGLDAGGELSEENIVFKALRAAGYIDKMRNSISAIYDDEISVNESVESPAKQLKNEFNAPEHVNIDLSVYGPTTISIESLNVDDEYKGKGHGTQTLKQVIDLADKLGVIIELEIGCSGEENEFDLVKWYNKYGFKHINGFWRRDPK